MGLVITIALIVACYFLFRSFLKHLRRVPASFDDPAGSVGGSDADESRVTPADRDR
jgi:hypothetical protein